MDIKKIARLEKHLKRLVDAGDRYPKIRQEITIEEIRIEKAGLKNPIDFTMHLSEEEELEMLKKCI